MTVRHLERYDWSPHRDHPPDPARWPWSIPAVQQVMADGGLEIAAGITFLVGENGSGKSTLVEAMAAAYPRRGFVHAAMPHAGAAPQREDSPLRYQFRAVTHPRASPAGWFLRSETLHDTLEGLGSSAGSARRYGDADLLARSHGESVLFLLREHFAEPGVYFLDEPEAALSFTSTLALVAVLVELAAAGSQVVAATHSPLLAALPGATLIEVDQDGFRQTTWEDLELVASWRRYLDDPDTYLRHLL